jgi:hypothetical protein
MLRAIICRQNEFSPYLTSQTGPTHDPFLYASMYHQGRMNEAEIYSRISLHQPRDRRLDLRLALEPAFPTRYRLLALFCSPPLAASLEEDGQDPGNPNIDCTEHTGYKFLQHLCVFRVEPMNSEQQSARDKYFARKDPQKHAEVLLMTDGPDPRPRPCLKLEQMESWVGSQSIRSLEGAHGRALSSFRLLDVSSPRRFRIVEQIFSDTPSGAVNASAYPRYAALSHRWGRNQHFTTTMENIEKMKR